MPINFDNLMEFMKLSNMLSSYYPALGALALLCLVIGMKVEVLGKPKF